MAYLEYKDFLGSVEYDDRCHSLIGRVQGLREKSLSYSGSTLAELEQNFHRSVEKYIESCERMGEKPKKSYGGPLNVRLGPDLHSRAVAMAEKLDRTLNSFIKEAVERALYDYETRY